MEPIRAEPASEPAPADRSGGTARGPSCGFSGRVIVCTRSPDPVDTVESLVADAISWGLKEDVTRRVIPLHNDLTKCRKILADAAERNRRQVA